MLLIQQKSFEERMGVSNIRSLVSILWNKIRDYVKARSACNVIQILWIKSKQTIYPLTHFKKKTKKNKKKKRKKKRIYNN